MYVNGSQINKLTDTTLFDPKEYVANAEKTQIISYKYENNIFDVFVPDP